jgi:hypothetical protein
MFLVMLDSIMSVVRRAIFHISSSVGGPLGRILLSCLTADVVEVEIDKQTRGVPDQHLVAPFTMSHGQENPHKDLHGDNRRKTYRMLEPTSIQKAFLD